MVLWTAFGSVFALMLGYSRIPYAAAQDGCFFRWFGTLHPTKHFPHRSLVLIGAVSIACSFLSLGTVIGGLLVTRVIVQFIGQIVALMWLRRHAPNRPRPYRMWLYPLPCFLALAGWLFVFLTTENELKAFAGIALAAGLLIYLCWAKLVQQTRPTDLPQGGGGFKEEPEPKCPITPTAPGTKRPRAR